MYEGDVAVTTRHGNMPSFLVYPERDEAIPAVILYMDAPGIREGLRDMCRRIAKEGYVCIMPDLYYRNGSLRFDIQRRTEAMGAVVIAAMNSLTSQLVIDDTACMLAFLDGQEKVKSGKVGCVGFCMSGQYVTTVAAHFPNRIAAVASMYGVGLVTEKEDSPHLLVDKIKAELYYAFAEYDRSVPAHVVSQFAEALAKTNLSAEIQTFSGAEHGFCFPERDHYMNLAAETAWQKALSLFDRTLRQE
jgi:carboxymethylenebutenolidase